MAGQGNKNRTPGSGNKGYGPGSGRGFSGAGIGGNVGGFGKNKSPSGKNMSGQGGNNPFSKGGDKGFGDKGQLSFAGLKNFLGIGNPDSNEAHRLKVGLRNNLDYSDMQEGPTIKINPKQWLGGFEDKTNIPTGWIRKNIPKWASGNWINHTLKSPKKIMPTDPRYNYGNRKGEKKLDKDAADYLKWIARHNPDGTTVSEMKKIYARNLKDGRHTLQQVMKMNPANTIPFYALIDDTVQDKTDTKTTTTTTKGDMALTKNQKAVQDIYGTHLGRKAATEGQDYWSKQLDAGGSIEDVIRGIQSGSEYQNRANYLKANPNATEAQLDANITPGGGSYTKSKGGMTGVSFDPNNTWSKHHLTTGNKEFTDELAAINKELGITAMSGFSDKVEGAGTSPGANYGEYTVGKTHDAVGKPWSPGGGSQTPPGGGSQTPPGQTPAAGLTQADLDKWWAGIDKSAWTGGGTKESSKWDDFTSFMGALQPFLGGGGGYNYPSMGYGGYAPGGVASANPYGNMMNFMNAFKSIGSGGGSGAGALTSSSLTK